MMRYLGNIISSIAVIAMAIVTLYAIYYATLYTLVIPQETEQTKEEQQ